MSFDIMLNWLKRFTLLDFGIKMLYAFLCYCSVSCMSHATRFIGLIILTKERVKMRTCTDLHCTVYVEMIRPKHLASI
jgi:hypothetical protein